MATLRELIIKISANSQSFQSEITRASRMGSDYYKTMQNGGRQVAVASRESQKALAEVNAQLASAKSTAAGVAGALAGSFATSHNVSIVMLSDELDDGSGMPNSSIYATLLVPQALARVCFMNVRFSL